MPLHPKTWVLHLGLVDLPRQLGPLSPDTRYAMLGKYLNSARRRPIPQTEYAPVPLLGDEPSDT